MRTKRLLPFVRWHREDSEWQGVSGMFRKSLPVPNFEKTETTALKIPVPIEKPRAMCYNYNVSVCARTIYVLKGHENMKLGIESRCPDFISR